MLLRIVVRAKGEKGRELLCAGCTPSRRKRKV
jgi:hypothetical protein